MISIRGKGMLTKILIAFLDAIIVVLSFGIALWIRFDFRMEYIPTVYKAEWLSYAPFQVLLTIILFSIMHMYRYIWRCVGLKDILAMVGSVLLTFAVSNGIMFLCGFYLPVSIAFIALIMQIILFVGMRVSVRVMSEGLMYLRYMRQDNRKRIMLIGAGSAGRMLLQEMTSSENATGKICCIIDDNPVKMGKAIFGVPIVGGREKIAEYVEKENISQIIVAIPSILPADKKEILHLCGETGVNTKILPGIMQVVNGQVRIADLKDVQIEDLLGRDSIKLDLHSLHGFLCNRTVLVTGGGGSIGSELCRQIARYDPKELIILDIYENSAYSIQQELIRNYGKDLKVKVEIASVRDKERIGELFEKYKPDIVFHAAAHKHVPLMEDCPEEAVKNNIFGTYNVVDAAEKNEVSKFIMISTDKAVNPTNVMGATKRFCEMIVQSRYESKTEFCCVRFGNVLGSNGSVVPLFRQQIKEGGPVTITDKRITRFFMTIPEAVQLVLEAGTMAKRSQIFVLDMGEPVKIIDLAEKLIKLSGLEPFVDIDIREVGLRPGEKLYEELLMASNDLSSTANEKIFVEQQNEINRRQIQNDLHTLKEAIKNQGSNEQIIALLKELVPTYHSPDEVNSASEKKSYVQPSAREVVPV